MAWRKQKTIQVKGLKFVLDYGVRRKKPRS